MGRKVGEKRLNRRLLRMRQSIPRRLALAPSLAQGQGPEAGPWLSRGCSRCSRAAVRHRGALCGGARGGASRLLGEVESLFRTYPVVDGKIRRLRSCSCRNCILSLCEVRGPQRLRCGGSAEALQRRGPPPTGKWGPFRERWCRSLVSG